MTTIATGNRRLLKLAAFLRTLPREQTTLCGCQVCAALSRLDGEGEKRDE